jgi:acetylornithine deacetylase/succinyl-diaminopimelate desuccinylase-like protein
VEEAVLAGTSGLGAEAVELCGELIRFNTVNPPGNEAEAQDLLAAKLGDAGFECRR